MTALVVAAVIASLALALAAVAITADTSRWAKLERALDDRAEDLDTYHRTVMEMTERFAETAIKLAHRETDQQAAVLSALITDRNRLVSAVLSIKEPAAARTLGLMDKTEADATRATSLREMLEETWGERAQAETETRSADGQAIIPVGM